MKRLMNRFGFCLLVLLLIAGISCAAINDAAIYDSIAAGKAMADLTDAVDANYSNLKIMYGENKIMPAG